MTGSSRDLSPSGSGVREPTFIAQGGAVYWFAPKLVLLSEASIQQLLDIFEREREPALSNELWDARRDAKAQARAKLEPIPELKPLTCTVRALDPSRWPAVPARSEEAA